ncbi:hypothetical protein F8S13_26910 [Chloroflexia bacterium SDU3-3]|nr:hypothetical protein F8S13_26910 [Chloroflexia bacterium SDU3-3]
MKRLITLLAALVLAACTTTAAPPAAPTATEQSMAFGGQLVRTPYPPPPAAVPLMTAHQARVQAALDAGEPVFLTGLDDHADRAQRLAAQAPEVAARTHDKQGRMLRSEVFGVYALTGSEITDDVAACRTTACNQVQIYIYPTNITMVAIVAPDSGQVLRVDQHNAAQPQRVPDDLIAIADQLAITSPLMRQTLGVSPTLDMLWHPSYKSALHGTTCERSKHLCLSATVAWGRQAMWAIVDLTDYRVIGMEITELGDSGRHTVSEKRLQNAVVERDFCDRATTHREGDWAWTAQLTNSDGIRISDVRWRGELVLESYTLVDVHITYNAGKQFGYADAAGCPLFSSAVVVARDGPALSHISGRGHTGIRIMQDFLQDGWPSACNYRYKQALELYDDGSFRPFWGSWGRGCGTNGTYRPVLRIALPQGHLAAWNGSGWSPWDTERWANPDGPTTAAGSAFRWGTIRSTYELRPNRRDGAEEHDDHAFVLATQSRPGEGASDLPTLGDCCRTTYEQGPESYLTGESLQNVPITLWYVPQVNLNPTQCWADSALVQGVIVPVVKACYVGPTFQRLAPLGGVR